MSNGNRTAICIIEKAVRGNVKRPVIRLEGRAKVFG
jgi:hypothetical protein